MFNCYKCIDSVRCIFSPELDFDDQELVIKNVLRKLFFYLIFLIITTIIALLILPAPPLLYYFTNRLQSVLIYKRFNSKDGKEIIFEEIITVDDYYSYIDNVLKPTVTQKQILGVNWVMGQGRIRQVRVGQDTCFIPPTLKGVYAHCYSEYTPSKADINDIANPSCKSKTGRAWKYYYANDTLEMPFYGKVAYYDGAGFYMDTSREESEFGEQITCLKDNKWISLGTRGVFMHFTAYNPNIKWLIFIKLIFEFPPTGGIVTSSQFLPIKLIRYVTKTDFAIFALEIIFVLFIIYYTVEELLELFYYKWDFFKNIWNVVDLAIIIIGYILIFLNLYLFITLRRFNMLDGEKHVCIERYIYIQHVFNNLLAVMLFLIWMKLFKYFNFSRTLGQLGRTLSMCAREIFGFSVMFFIVFFAFAQAGYLLFGDQVEGFSTFPRSVLTLLMTILGDFEYHEIAAGSPFMAPIFFATYIFFVFFVLFNMFLAIVTDAYLVVKSDIAHHSAELEMADVIRQGLRHGSTRMGIDLFRNKKTLPGNDIINSLRQILKLCKFSELQIDALFTKYDVNEHVAIRESDIRTFIAKLKTSIYQDACAPNKRTSITVEQYVCQRHKIDIIDKNIKILLSKVCTRESCKKKTSCTKVSVNTYRKCKKRKSIPNPPHYNTCI